MKNNASFMLVYCFSIMMDCMSHPKVSRHCKHTHLYRPLHHWHHRVLIVIYWHCNIFITLLGQIKICYGFWQLVTPNVLLSVIFYTHHYFSHFHPPFSLVKVNLKHRRHPVCVVNIPLKKSSLIGFKRSTLEYRNTLEKIWWQIVKPEKNRSLIMSVWAYLPFYIVSLGFFVYFSVEWRKTFFKWKSPLKIHETLLCFVSMKKTHSIFALQVSLN